MNTATTRRTAKNAHTRRLTAADVGRAATLALRDELDLAPKPGIVLR